MHLYAPFRAKSPLGDFAFLHFSAIWSTRHISDLDIAVRQMGSCNQSCLVSPEGYVAKTVTDRAQGVGPVRSCIAFLCVFSVLIILVGCSGSGSTNNPTAGSADFTLSILPSTITLTPGGPAQAVAITASPVNSFTGNVSVTVGSLPTGVTVTPMTLSLVPGGLQQITVTASPTMAAGSASIALQASSGSLTHSITAPVTVNAAVTTATLSATSFNFGNNLVNNTLTQSAVTVTNTGQAALTLSPTLSGDPSYTLASTGSCGAQVAPAANCAVMVSYTPKTASAPGTQNAVLNLGFSDVATGTPQTVTLSGTS